MKKFILIVFCIFFASSCFANDGKITNRRGLILQALDGGALGYICPKYALDNEDCRMGQLVYFDFNYDFVDGQRFNISKNEYFYPNGVYKYLNKDNIYKTVRKIEIRSNY